MPIDMSRWYRENQSPAEYLRSSYYELWFNGLQRLIADKGFLTDANPPKAIGKADIGPKLRQGTKASVDVQVPARFRVGDAVRVKNEHPRTHTRMPRYCRGKRGVIHMDHGVMVFPDTHALGQGQKPQHCYSVRFTAAELWGRAGPDSVHIDLWDDYLLAAT
jgi:nitrile hydratase beta subunit